MTKPRKANEVSLTELFESRTTDLLWMEQSDRWVEHYVARWFNEPLVQARARFDFLAGLASGRQQEHDRRKPIDLATKKLIEALECVTNRYESAHERSDRPSDLAKGCTHGIYVACSKALAEFRASLEDGEC